MNVSLTPELEKLVQAKVSSGQYNNASEVMREALRMMIRHDLANSYNDWLRAEVEIGLRQIERGETAEFDMDEIVQSVLADHRRK